MKVEVRVKRPRRKPRALAVRIFRRLGRLLVDFLIASASGVVAALVYDLLSN